MCSVVSVTADSSLHREIKIVREKQHSEHGMLTKIWKKSGCSMKNKIAYDDTIPSF